MKISEKILHRMFRDRESFTADEIAYVELVVAAYNEERSLLGKKTALPTKFVEVGGMAEVSGRKFRCVVADRVNVPSEACSGCSLSKLYLGCGDLQCGPFDRRDHRFVWFKEVKG